MEFRILGPVDVLRDGRPLALGGPKQRMLLAALLLRPNEVVSIDELIDALWGDRAPERATKSLHVYVWQLRKLLGHEILQTRSPGYALRVESDDLDLHRFESLCTEARGKRPAEAAVLLRDALALFRGRPLAGLRLRALRRGGGRSHRGAAPADAREPDRGRPSTRTPRGARR